MDAVQDEDPADADTSSVQVLVIGARMTMRRSSSLRQPEPAILVRDAEPAELTRAIQAVAAGEERSPSGVRA
jgi:hypothetical protein